MDKSYSSDAAADESSDDGEGNPSPSHDFENETQLFEEADIENAFPANSEGGGMESDTGEISHLT